PELQNFLFGDKIVKTSEMANKYDELAFQNFKLSRDYLLKEKPPLTKDTLLEVHRKMMKGGVEGVQESDLGLIRDGQWYGNVSSREPISDDVLKEIQKNPYLTWVPDSWGTPGINSGKIVYPNSEYVRKEGLDLIRKNHPELVKEIEEFQGMKI